MQQTVVYRCWWCGEPAEQTVEIEPERKAPKGSHREVVPARVAWACGRHATVKRGKCRVPRREGWRTADGRVWRP